MDREALIAAMRTTAKPKTIAVTVEVWGTVYVRPPTVGEVCWRRPNFEPPCRLNIEPGVEADFEMVGCG